MGSGDIEEVKEADVAPAPEHVYVDVLNWKEVKEVDFWRAIIAEFLCTQFFVGFSIGGILAAEFFFVGSPVAIHIWVILFHMVLILIVIYAFGHLSGAHFNPATSITLLCTRRITLIRCFFYVISQLTGAIAGAALMHARFVSLSLFLSFFLSFFLK
jgi:aquaporin-4